MKYSMLITVLLFGSTNAYCHEEEKMSLKYTLAVFEYSWGKKDGSFVYDISTAIVELFVIAPCTVMKWLDAHDPIKKELLSNWQYNVFTDFAGEKKEQQRLKLLRENLIKAVKDTDFKDKRLLELKGSVLKNLQKIKIDTID